jgi:SAM-dependent methyltransferase
LSQIHQHSRVNFNIVHMRAITRVLAAATLQLSARLPLSESLAQSEPKSRRELLSAASAVAAAATATGWTCLTTGRSAVALAPDVAQVRYDAYAASYDQLDGGALPALLGIVDARKEWVGRASGHVLEIGVGTGLNLPHYDPARVKSLTLVDVSNGMLRQALARASELDNLRPIPVEAFRADATSELVPLFGEGRFDSVVDTFSLCVMGQDGARRCLDQMSLVAKKNTGRVLLLENTRSSSPLLGLYQDLTADAAAGTGGKGCVYNQDVSRLIRDTGRLEIVSEDRYAAGLFRGYECKRAR